MAAIVYADTRRAPLTVEEYDRDIANAVAVERERCAKIALAHDSRRYANQVFQGVEIASEIRGS